MLFITGYAAALHTAVEYGRVRAEVAYLVRQDSVVGIEIQLLKIEINNLMARDAARDTMRRGILAVDCPSALWL